MPTDGADLLFAGPGETRALCRSVDWGATPLGRAEEWPAALRATVRLTLDSAFPMCVFAGPELVLVYNDRYVEVLGRGKHPAALGSPARVVWGEVWEQIEPELGRVFAGGATVRWDDQRFVIDRNGVTEETWWTYALSPLRDEAGAIVAVHGVLTETTGRVRAEAALRTSETRQAFLLTLSDTLQPLSEAAAIEGEACRLLGEHLGADRTFYCEYRMAEGVGLVQQDYVRGDLFSLRGSYQILDFQWTLELYGRGRPVAIDDVWTTELIPDAYRAASAAAHVAWVVVPLVKDGTLVGTFCVATTRPRVWTPAEIELARETAERLWATIARTRAEAARRRSEEKYRAMFESLAEGVSILEVLFDDEGEAVDYRFVENNPAVVRMTGVADSVGRRVLELFPDFDRRYIRIAGDVAKSGRPARFQHHVPPIDRWFDVHESRIGGDGSPFVIAAFADITERKRAEQALQASEAHFRGLAETVPLIVWESGNRSVVDYFNQRWYDYTGLDRDSGDADVWSGVIHPDDVAEAVRRSTEAIRTGAAYEMDYRLRRADGQYRRHLARAVRMPETQRWIGMALDIQDLSEAEQALRASEERFRQFAENSTDVLWLWNVERQSVEYVSPAVARVWGLAPERVMADVEALYAVVHPEDRAWATGAIARVVVGETVTQDYRIVRPDTGQLRWLRDTAFPIRDVDGRVHRVGGIAQDVTELKEAEAAADQARRLAARDELRRALAEAEEAERRRLARELHDQLGQQLTAFALGTDDALRLADAHDGARAAPDSPLVRRLKGLHGLAREMQAGTRYLALELRPPELDDLGLEAALETYVRAWSARYGVAAEVAVTGLHQGAPMPAEVGSTLYRIAQEALTNVAKHAGAHHVSVIVEKPDGEVRLIVEDDGRGFDPEAVAARVRAEQRLGLAGMQERAALVGGTVTVESSDGFGTAVYARLPVVPTSKF